MKRSSVRATSFAVSGFANQRRLLALASLFGLATCAAVVLLPVEAQAACREGFCVSGSDQNGIHTVIFTVYINDYTHINVNTLKAKHELGANVRQFSFPNGPSGQLESFALQACTKHVFSSSCTPWATFTHSPQ